jgi:hypothetical protein
MFFTKATAASAMVSGMVHHSFNTSVINIPMMAAHDPINICSMRLSRALMLS